MRTITYHGVTWTPTEDEARAWDSFWDSFAAYALKRLREEKEEGLPPDIPAELEQGEQSEDT